MNGTYYKNPTFPSSATNNYQEESFSIAKELTADNNIETILKLNKGKKVNIFMNYSNNTEEKKYSGIIEQSGKEHIIISNPESGNWYLLLIKYLNYIEFEEKINY